jgi:hypothetical protein
MLVVVDIKKVLWMIETCAGWKVSRTQGILCYGMLMTCLYSGCERMLRRTQPLSINTNEQHIVVTWTLQRAGFLLKKQTFHLVENTKVHCCLLKEKEGKGERMRPQDRTQKLGNAEFNNWKAFIPFYLLVCAQTQEDNGGKRWVFISSYKI